MSTATSTILRVKRKIEDNPQDALVLVCKRVKLDTEEISPSLFVFRGTVDNQETIGVSNIVPKNELKFKAKHEVSDIIQKIRKERKQATQDSRYEIVNCSRNVKDVADNSEAFDLVDLQRDSGEDKDVQYKYDLYVAAQQEDFDVSMLDNLVSIENYEAGLIFESNGDNGQNPSEDEADDNDDSNDENNWRNEYPDTEDSSIDEEDMARAMERCDIDDLSSDSAEVKLYDYPPELFNDDVKRFGSSYAKYKAKVISEDTQNAPRDLIYCSKIRDLDEESIDGYKDNNDGFYYGEDEDTEQFKEQYADVDNISSDEYSPD